MTQRLIIVPRFQLVLHIVIFESTIFSLKTLSYVTLFRPIQAVMNTFLIYIVKMSSKIRHSAQLNVNSASVLRHNRWYPLQCKRLRYVLIQLDKAQAFRGVHTNRPIDSSNFGTEIRSNSRVFFLGGGNNSLHLLGPRFSEMLCHRLFPYPCLCAAANDFQDTFRM